MRKLIEELEMKLEQKQQEVNELSDAMVRWKTKAKAKRTTEGKGKLEVRTDLTTTFSHAVRVTKVRWANCDGKCKPRKPNISSEFPSWSILYWNLE